MLNFSSLFIWSLFGMLSRLVFNYISLAIIIMLVIYWLSKQVSKGDKFYFDNELWLSRRIVIRDGSPVNWLYWSGSPRSTQRMLDLAKSGSYVVPVHVTAYNMGNYPRIKEMYIKIMLKYPEYKERIFPVLHVVQIHEDIDFTAKWMSGLNRGERILRGNRVREALDRFRHHFKYVIL